MRLCYDTDDWFLRLAQLTWANSLGLRRRFRTADTKFEIFLSQYIANRCRTSSALAAGFDSSVH